LEQPLDIFTVLIIHICGGIIGVLSGSTALVVRKGSLLHRRFGDVVVISMLIMAAAGAYVAFTKSQPTNVMAGVFTFYLVATAWLTVMRKEKETGRTEFGLLLLGLAAGTGGLIFGWRSPARPGLKPWRFRTALRFWLGACFCRRRHSHAHSRRCFWRKTSRAASVANVCCFFIAAGPSSERPQVRFGELDCAPIVHPQFARHISLRSKLLSSSS
jgi:hypothetical protein